MKKRVVALLCGSILLLYILVGCQNSDIPTEQNNRTSAATTTTASSTTTTTTTTTTRTRGTAVPESDTVLGEAMEQQIKEDYLAWKINQSPDNYADATVSDIQIKQYLGQYSNCTALVVEDSFMWVDDMEEEITIAGYVFVAANPMYKPMVYSEGEFMYLSEAYEQNLVTDEDVRCIHERYTEI